jgi:hypothetical protein
MRGAAFLLYIPEVRRRWTGKANRWSDQETLRKHAGDQLLPDGWQRIGGMDQPPTNARGWTTRVGTPRKSLR